jgi:hypothetical protein
MIVKVQVPWFAIRLIPIHRPKTANRKTLNSQASIRSPDRNALDLDGHVHARIQVGPVFWDVA